MFSLIVTTDGNRNVEFDRLMKSLEKQTYRDFEVIAVLQTQNNDTVDIANKYDVNVKTIITERCSLSKARNIGLELVTGDIVAFPDDDCWYAESLLEKIAPLFCKNDVVCCNVFDPDSNRFFSARQSKKDVEEIDISNAFKYPISVGIFAKNDGSKFDENLGAGTKWGSGEETDYILDKLLKKEKISYFKNIHVYHPYLNTSIKDMEKKSFNYGKGYGALVIKRINLKQYGIIQDLLITLCRSFMGTIVYIFNPPFRKKYTGRIKGILYGLMNYEVEKLVR